MLDNLWMKMNNRDKRLDETYMSDMNPWKNWLPYKLILKIF